MSGYFMAVKSAIAKAIATLSASLAGSAGAGLIGFKQSGAGAVQRTADVELRERVSIKQFGAVFDGITDDTAAWSAAISYVKSINGSLVCPGGTSLVSQIVLDGGNYSIDTSAGVTLKQKTGTPTNTGQIVIIKGHDITVGDLNFIGNIATDTGEYHHCVYVYDDSATVSSIYNISLGRLFGTNIRGDVLYVGGLAVRPAKNIQCASVGGANVYRNIVSIVGGQVSIGAIYGGSGVGYRDLDVEPNTGGAQPSDVRVGYHYGSSIQITCDDPAVLNNCVQIDSADLDLTRQSNSVPAYPVYPGANGYALGVTLCEYAKFGYLKIRNYNSYPITFGSTTLKSQVYIDFIDVANCGAGENTWNAIFAEQGTGGVGYLEIGQMVISLVANTKAVFNANGMRVRVRKGSVSGGLLAIGTPRSHFENLDIDMAGATGYLLNGCGGSTLQNVNVTNSGSARLAYSSANLNLIGVVGTFNALLATNSYEAMAANCIFNGIRYRMDTLDSNASNRAGTATFSGATTKVVALSNAEGDANYKVLLTANANKTFWVTNKTTTGFTINASSTSSDSVDWMVIR